MTGHTRLPEHLIKDSKHYTALSKSLSSSTQNHSNMRFQLLTGVTAIASLLASSFAIPATSISTREEAVTTDVVVFTEDYRLALANLFNTIEAIPDDVLVAGDEATEVWLIDHGYRSDNVKLQRDLDSSVVTVDAVEARDVTAAQVNWWKVAKCVASVAELIVSTAIPAAKILKIKKLIKALGGTKDAIKLLIGATSKAEKLKAGGQALVDLAAELSGIKSVKDDCF